MRYLVDARAQLAGISTDLSNQIRSVLKTGFGASGLRLWRDGKNTTSGAARRAAAL